MSSKSAHASIADKLEAELLPLVENIEPEKLQAWLLVRTPSEIKALAHKIRVRAKELFVQCDAMEKVVLSNRFPKANEAPEPTKVEDTRQQYIVIHKQCSSFAAVVIASGTLSEAKEIVRRERIRPEQHPLLFPVLQKVPPSWLPEFVDHLFSLRWTPFGMSIQYWNLADELIQTGIVSESESPNYVHGMVIASRFVGRREERGALHFLRCHPHLLNRQVWRLFELESQGPANISAYDSLASVKTQRPFLTPEQTWSHALRQLSREGLLDRDRLLDVSLDALLREFPGGMSAWLANFHEALEPTPKERRSRAATYLKLLSSSQATPVRYGLQVLPDLTLNHRISDDDLLAALKPTLRSKSKTTLTAALKHLENIAERRPNLRQFVLLAALEIISLSDASLQKRVLRLLNAYPEGRDAEVLAALLTWSDLIVPSLLETLRQIAPASLAESRPKTETPAPEAIQFSYLDESRRIHPVSGFEELIDVVIRVLENPFDIMETERVLDGMLRFPADETSARLLGPVTKRARDLFKLYKDDHYHHKKSTPADFGKLLTVILTWSRDPHNWSPKHLSSAQRFHFARLDGIRESLLAKRSLPLLSTPTHAGFWLDPVTFTNRAMAWQKAGQKPALQDLIIALLRLAPEKRDEALTKAAALPDEWGLAVRYALGEEDIAIGDDISLWIAAARVRYPGKTDSLFLKKYPGLGPGAGEIGHWRFFYETQKVTNRHSGKTHDFNHIGVAISPPVKGAVPEDYLTVSLHTRDVYGGYISGEEWWKSVIRFPDKSAYLWLYSYWPSDKNTVFGIGFGDYANHPNLGADYCGGMALFPMLADPLEEYGPNALLLLSLGLVAKDAGTRMSALQAIAAGTSAGRLNLSALAQSLTQLIPLRLFSATRLYRSLEEWARISEQQSMVTVDFLISFLLANLTAIPDGLTKLLSFLHESLIKHRRKLESDQTSEIQRLFPGQNKAAKLARQIAKL